MIENTQKKAIIDNRTPSDFVKLNKAQTYTHRKKQMSWSYGSFFREAYHVLWEVQEEC